MKSNMGNRLKNFFIPEITSSYLIRVSLIVFISYIFFGHICIPFRIRGKSMEPTYNDGGFNFCWRPAVMFFKPARFDIVAIRLSGNKVMLLKRIVAFEGETVEFDKGRLLINGKEISEPYVKYAYNWSLPARIVKQGNVYVLGDNRNMPMENHVFGQTSIRRIAGKSLW
ncbi:signal peptidase I [Elusimicrobiota bacterium]